MWPCGRAHNRSSTVARHHVADCPMSGRLLRGHGWSVHGANSAGEVLTLEAVLEKYGACRAAKCGRFIIIGGGTSAPRMSWKPARSRLPGTRKTFPQTRARRFTRLF